MSRMRPHLVVVLPPARDDDTRLGQRHEHLLVPTFRLRSAILSAFQVRMRKSQQA